MHRRSFDLIRSFKPSQVEGSKGHPLSQPASCQKHVVLNWRAGYLVARDWRLNLDYEFGFKFNCASCVGYQGFWVSRNKKRRRSCNDTDLFPACLTRNQHLGRIAHSESNSTVWPFQLEWVCIFHSGASWRADSSQSGYVCHLLRAVGAAFPCPPFDLRNEKPAGWGLQVRGGPKA